MAANNNWKRQTAVLPCGTFHVGSFCHFDVTACTEACQLRDLSAIWASRRANWIRKIHNKAFSRSMFQFYAITFGSSFFNMILGYVKFATAIGFMQNTSTRVFIAYIGIVITNTMEWIYSFIIVMNNLFIYMVA